MSDETGTPEPETPEPEETSPPAETSEAPAQTAPSAAAAAMPAPPRGRFWDRPSRRTLLIVMAVFGVWAIAATAFAFTGHHGNGYHLSRGSMNSRRFGGMMGDADRNGGGMMNGNGGGMMNPNGGGFIACPPNGVYPPQAVNPTNAPPPVASPSGSSGIQYVPGGNCRIMVPGTWSGWSQSSSGTSTSQG